MPSGSCARPRMEKLPSTHTHKTAWPERDAGKDAARPESPFPAKGRPLPKKSEGAARDDRKLSETARGRRSVTPRRRRRRPVALRGRRRGTVMPAMPRWRRRRPVTPRWRRRGRSVMPAMPRRRRTVRQQSGIVRDIPHGKAYARVVSQDDRPAYGNSRMGISRPQGDCSTENGSEKQLLHTCLLDG